MSKYYPDISHYEDVKDWNKVKKNCPFLISKATQGTSYIDATLNEVIRQCEKRGIRYWLYAYLNKGNELAQAKFLVKTCKNKVGKYFVGYVLDVEAGNSASGVQKAMDYLKTQKAKMMLYTMYAQYDKYKNIIAMRPEKCAWWEARYGLNTGTYNAKYPCHKGVDLHQYTSRGSCPGISGAVDLNRITGQGKNEKWFTTSLKIENGDGTGEGAGGMNYFSTIKNDGVKGITKFLHNRGFGAGKNNLSKIAAANSQSKEVKDALFALAKEGKLIKPEGLNHWAKAKK